MTETEPVDAEPSPPPELKKPFLVRLFTEPMWVLGLVILVDEMDKNIVRGLITPLKEEFGVGDLGISVLLSLALLFNGLITVPAGYLADRWMRTRAIGHTVIGWSALTAAGAASVNFPMLVGMRSALGFGQAITEPSAASLIGDCYPTETRGKAFSIQQMMLFIGAGLGIGVGGAIGATLGWRPALVIMALPGALVAILVYRMKEPKRGAADLMAAIGANVELDADENPSLFEGGFRQFLRDMIDSLKADMRTILSIRTMRYALVGVAAILFSITAVAAWLPQFYERQLGVKPGFGEGFVGLVAMAGVPGVLIGGRLADRLAPKMQGGRLALPAIFLFVGMSVFTVGYLLKPSIPADVVQAQAAAEADADAAEADLDAIKISGDEAAIERADEAAEDARKEANEVGHEPLGYSSSMFLGVLLAQFVGFGVVCMSIPSLRAGLTDAVPAHLRGTGFGAFNLAAVIFGQAAAPFIVGGLSAAFDENLRTAFLIVTPVSLIGALVLYRARKFLDEDMQKIMMAVLQALQHEQEKAAEKAAEQGKHAT